MVALCKSVLWAMTKMTGDSHRPPRSRCPTNAAIEVPGTRWSMLVLRDMIFGNRRYFRELLQGSDSTEAARQRR